MTQGWEACHGKIQGDKMNRDIIIMDDVDDGKSNSPAARKAISKIYTELIEMNKSGKIKCFGMRHPIK